MGIGNHSYSVKFRDQCSPQANLESWPLFLISFMALGGGRCGEEKKREPVSTACVCAKLFMLYDHL